MYKLMYKLIIQSNVVATCCTDSMGKLSIKAEKL